jgi:hypothetical protein
MVPSNFRPTSVRDAIGRTAPGRLIRPFVFIILLVAGPALALAHGDWDWIRRGDFRDSRGKPCCGPSDCARIPDSEVEELPNGDFKLLPTGEKIPRSQTRPSPDAHYWRCHYYQNGTPVTRTLCFWRPVKDS